jgi:hypothetical protein
MCLGPNTRMPTIIPLPSPDTRPAGAAVPQAADRRAADDTGVGATCAKVAKAAKMPINIDSIDSASARAARTSHSANLANPAKRVRHAGTAATVPTMHAACAAHPAKAYGLAHGHVPAGYGTATNATLKGDVTWTAHEGRSANLKLPPSRSVSC